MNSIEFWSLGFEMFHGGRQLKTGKEKIGEQTSVSSRTSEAKVVLLALADG